MGKRAIHPEISTQYVELREEVYGLGYALSVNENIFPEAPGWPDSVVELWVDHVMTGGPDDSRPAVANIRLSRREAIALAEQILAVAERLPTQKEF